MSIQYGWTYAHRGSGDSRPAKKRPSAKRNRYRRSWKAKEHTLAMNATAVLPGRRAVRPGTGVNWKAMEKAGRVLVALALIAVTVLVLGKQSAWMEQLSGRLLAWRSSLAFSRPPRKALDKPEPAAGQPAAAPARSGEAAALSVVRTDANMNRTPVALLSDSALFYMNAAGQVWPVEPQNVPADLPVITGPTVREVPDAMGIGLQTELNLPLARQLLASKLAAQFSEIHLEPQGGATLYTREGVKILLSGGARAGRDLLRLETVMQDVSRRGQRISLIDLRYDQHVVVRPDNRK